MANKCARERKEKEREREEGEREYIYIYIYIKPDDCFSQKLYLTKSEI